MKLIKRPVQLAGNCSKLTANDMVNVAWQHNHEGVSLGSLAKQYTVSKSTIFNIVHKKTHD